MPIPRPIYVAVSDGLLSHYFRYTWQLRCNSVLNQAAFDAVYVQFCTWCVILQRLAAVSDAMMIDNNEEWPCGLLVNDPQYGWKTFNFDTWYEIPPNALAQMITKGTRNDWARNTSPNQNVKIYIGAPASSSAGNYYADADTLAEVIDAAKQNYSSYGGVMMWDAKAAQGPWQQ